MATNKTNTDATIAPIIFPPSFYFPLLITTFSNLDMGYCGLYTVRIRHLVVRGRFPKPLVIVGLVYSVKLYVTVAFEPVQLELMVPTFLPNAP